MKLEPLISVIIPVFNGEKYIADAIESVLAQTYHNIEVIVADDGSTDNSAQIAQQYASPVSYHYKSHSGLSATLNYGIELSKGSFLAFLDADDLWSPDKISAQLDMFDKKADMEASFVYMEQFKSPELEQASKDRLVIPHRVLPGYSKSTLLIKRKSFDRVGWFNSRWTSGDFIDWYARAIEEKIVIHMMTDVLAYRRVHENNMSHGQPRGNQFAQILKASLDRRRRNAQSIV